MITEAQKLSLGEQNSQVASLWREMDNADKRPYYELSVLRHMCKRILILQGCDVQHNVSDTHIKTTPMVL